MPDEYAGRLIKSEWEVRTMTDKKAARQIIVENHYARGVSCWAVYLHGLFRVGEDKCYGVAWWIPPIQGAAKATYPENWHGVLALSRLVVLPGVPKNAATFLMSHSRQLIDRVRWPCLVTYADEWQGHKGGIYMADNWENWGRGKPAPTYVKDGKLVSKYQDGHTSSHAEMLAKGCEFVGNFCKIKFVRFN